MFTYLTQLELQDLAADLVFALRRVYPRFGIELFDNPKSAKQLMRLNDYLKEYGIRQLAPRYFEEIIRETSFSDWKLILQYASRKSSVARFFRRVMEVV